MSNKLTFKEWKRRLQDKCHSADCNSDCDDCAFFTSRLSAWNFAQAQEQKEYKVLEAEHSILLAQFSKVDLERIRLEKENESLKKKLEKAEEVIRFYGDPEKWMIKTSDHWTKSNPRTYGDSELIEDYSHPNKDWVGSIVVGGKKARAYLKENE